MRVEVIPNVNRVLEVGAWQQLKLTDEANLGIEGLE